MSQRNQTLEKEKQKVRAFGGMLFFLQLVLLQVKCVHMFARLDIYIFETSSRLKTRSGSGSLLSNVSEICPSILRLTLMYFTGK